MRELLAREVVANPPGLLDDRLPRRRLQRLPPRAARSRSKARQALARLASRRRATSASRCSSGGPTSRTSSPSTTSGSQTRTTCARRSCPASVADLVALLGYTPRPAIAAIGQVAAIRSDVAAERAARDPGRLAAGEHRDARRTGRDVRSRGRDVHRARPNGADRPAAGVCAAGPRAASARSCSGTVSGSRPATGCVAIPPTRSTAEAGLDAAHRRHRSPRRRIRTATEHASRSLASDRPTWRQAQRRPPTRGSCAITRSRAGSWTSGSSDRCSRTDGITRSKIQPRHRSSAGSRSATSCSSTSAADGSIRWASRRRSRRRVPRRIPYPARPARRPAPPDIPILPHGRIQSCGPRSPTGLRSDRPRRVPLRPEGRRHADRRARDDARRSLPGDRRPRRAGSRSRRRRPAFVEDATGAGIAVTATATATGRSRSPRRTRLRPRSRSPPRCSSRSTSSTSRVGRPCPPSSSAPATRASPARRSRSRNRRSPTSRAAPSGRARSRSRSTAIYWTEVPTLLRPAAGREGVRRLPAARRSRARCASATG